MSGPHLSARRVRAAELRARQTRRAASKTFLFLLLAVLTVFAAILVRPLAWSLLVVGIGVGLATSVGRLGPWAAFGAFVVDVALVASQWGSWSRMVSIGLGVTGTMAVLEFVALSLSVWVLRATRWAR